MERLGLEDTVVEMEKRSGLRWMGHVMRRNDDEPVKKAWDLKVDGISGRGMRWKGKTKFITDAMKKESRIKGWSK